MTHILAIDQGTTSTRAIIFDADLHAKTTAQEEFRQIYPNPGWVEHAPQDLLDTTLRTCRDAIAAAGLSAQDITALGITNQRETTLVWDRTTGQPVYNAIVWQDRRTAPACRSLHDAGHQALVQDRTGLLLDPYFSGTKLAWILENIDGARARANAGNLLFGTVDCYLIWHLTGGAVHATDATNAARTMLFDIHTGVWCEEICDLLDIPVSMLPDVRDCAADFGQTQPDIFGAAIQIGGVAGDQQAATIGQACFQPGMLKSTYGTGCFALLNTGSTPVKSNTKLLTTIAYQLNGERTYALEGSIFIAGAVVQWLRDELGLIDAAAQTGPMAATSDPDQPIIMVPAFTGLGAPYWNADCRGAIFGLTRNTAPADFARAALESVGYQTRDLLDAMKADWQDGAGDNVLRVDGGMSGSDWTMQFLSDILGAPVDRPAVLETTALGVAWLAGMQAGVLPGPDAFAQNWSAQTSFIPKMDETDRTARYAAWKRAVAAAQAV